MAPFFGEALQEMGKRWCEVQPAFHVAFLCFKKSGAHFASFFFLRRFFWRAMLHIWFTHRIPRNFLSHLMNFYFHFFSPTKTGKKVNGARGRDLEKKIERAQKKIIFDFLLVPSEHMILWLPIPTFYIHNELAMSVDWKLWSESCVR